MVKPPVGMLSQQLGHRFMKCRYQVDRRPSSATYINNTFRVFAVLRKNIYTVLFDSRMYFEAPACCCLASFGKKEIACFFVT